MIPNEVKELLKTVRRLRIYNFVMEVVAIVGPTGSGKSYISHNLARKLRSIGVESEIISCDSMQVYRYFDIGTDKVSWELRKEFNYHLIDILDPDEGRFSAGEFRKKFDEIVSDLVKKRKIGILVGGTGLYYKAVKVGIFEGPSANLDVRQKLYRLSQENGVEYLYYKLRKIDPEYSEKISKNDLKRIVRVLEVYEITGKTFSELHKQATKPSPFGIYSFFVLPERKELYQSINNRVDEMIRKGLIDEVRWIIQRYQKEIYPLTSIGYKEVVDFLDGKIEYRRMIELIKKNTRNFAKRQITLFKNTQIDKVIHIIKITYENLDNVVEVIFNEVVNFLKNQ